MKNETIAIISDIHANRYALEAFMNYIDSNKINCVLNLGDFVQIGPHPKQVAEVVLSDPRFINVLGNNETSLLESDFPHHAGGALSHKDWTLWQLGKELLGKIREVPLSRMIEIHGIKMLMVHSRLGAPWEDLLLYQGKPLDDFVNDYGTEPDYVLVGHTHCQMLVTYWKGKPILNPGSLGCSDRPVMSFCLAHIQDRELNFEFKNLYYDNSRLREDYIKEQVPKMPLIAKFMGIEY